MDRLSPSTAQVREIVSEHIAELAARGQPETDAEQGLHELHRQLVTAAQDYQVGPLRQRQAVCDAIIAVSEFLKGQGFSGATMVPLSRVVWAIVDLCQQNHPDPLFCEKRSKAKPRRNLTDAVRRGQMAAIADAWIESATADEGDEVTMLNRAARHMSGLHFGILDRAALNSARTYQRQIGHNELVYKSYEQMRDALAAEADAVGGGFAGLRAAVLAQIKALNIKKEMQNP